MGDISAADSADSGTVPDGTVTAEPDQAARIAELERQNTVERVSFETGVPVGLLAGAETEDDMLQLATNAMIWRTETAPGPPPPQTGAVPVDAVNGVGTIGPGDRLSPRYAGPQTRDQLSRMSAGEIMQAYRSGQLSQLGVGAPTPNGQTPMARRR